MKQDVNFYFGVYISLSYRIDIGRFVNPTTDFSNPDGGRRERPVPFGNDILLV